MVHTRHFPRGATAWSPPSRYDVMTGNFGSDDPLEAELCGEWLDAIQRATGFDLRHLMMQDSDRSRRSSRAVEHGGRQYDPEDGPDQGRALRSPRQGGRGEAWVRETHPRFEDRDGRGAGGTARHGTPGEGRSATGALGHSADRPPTAPGQRRYDGGGAAGGLDMYRDSHGGSRYGEGHAPSRGASAHDNGRRPLVAPEAGRGEGHDAGGDRGGGEAGPPEDGGRAVGPPPGPDPLEGGAVTDHGEDDDADGGDDGPERGGGRVALVPGPGAGGRRGTTADETSGPGAEQPGPPPAAHAAGGSQETAEPSEPTGGGAADTGAAPADPDQRQQGSWGWGWWGSGSWQGGSSHGGWWDRQRGDGDDGDAWARWNCGGHEVLPGSHSGYGGGGRRRPKPGERAAALGRPLNREEWIEELIADPPNPKCREFRSLGAWEKWVRGVFRFYQKIGDAKFKVKSERANCDREAQGGDPDYSTRGGRAAAMDPSTAFDQRGARDDGQAHAERGGGSGRGGGAAAAGGAAASSSSDRRASAVGAGGSRRRGRDGTEAGTADAGEAAPGAAPTVPGSPGGPGDPPPGFDGGSGRHGEDGGARAAAEGGAGAAAPFGPGWGGHGAGPSGGDATAIGRDLGQVGGAARSYPATDHRDPSCPPVAKGTRRRPVVCGPTAPLAASKMMKQGRGMAVARRATTRGIVTRTSLLHRPAPRAPTGVRRL